MRYTQTHREETHRKLLKVAAAALRDKGPDRLGVADVMKAAGLTHGGFYAYFESREALMIEAFTTAMRCCASEVPPREPMKWYAWDAAWD